MTELKLGRPNLVEFADTLLELAQQDQVSGRDELDKFRHHETDARQRDGSDHDAGPGREPAHRDDGHDRADELQPSQRGT